MHNFSFCDIIFLKGFKQNDRILQLCVNIKLKCKSIIGLLSPKLKSCSMKLFYNDAFFSSLCCSGFKPFVCLICNTTFTRQHSLNYHMLIHNNQSRFTCKDCGRKFRHPSHFKVTPSFENDFLHKHKNMYHTSLVWQVKFKSMYLRFLNLFTDKKYKSNIMCTVIMWNQI